MNRTLLVTLAATLSFGCAMQDSTAPVPQADTPVFGRVAAIRQLADEPGVAEVDIRTGLPETLRAIMQSEGRTIPELEKDLVSRVRVTPDTVCIADLVPVDLDSFRAGQEVAVVPVPGTSAMVGTKLLLTTAAELYVFSSYQVRYLARSLPEVPAAVLEPADPQRVNSAGTERCPVPVGDGRVVYFAAGLLPPVGGSGAPRGAERAGMRGSDGELEAWATGGYRPYRTALGPGGWSAPEPVALPGLDPAASARITWVDAEETACLVTVERAEAPTRLFAARRGSSAAPWGALEPVERVAGESLGDAQRFGGSDAALVWTVYDANGSDLWLAMPTGDGQPLEPRINTLGAEWAPRVGPGTRLYFCRGERQLLFGDGVVQEVRLAGRQRRPIQEAAPTADGTYLFLQTVRYTPGVLDTNLAVAGRTDGGWGEATPLDAWRP